MNGPAFSGRGTAAAREPQVMRRGSGNLLELAPAEQSVTGIAKCVAKRFSCFESKIWQDLRFFELIGRQFHSRAKEVQVSLKAFAAKTAMRVQEVASFY